MTIPSNCSKFWKLVNWFHFYSYLFVLFFLKVSKSQKHFFLKLYCPKHERNIRQNLPYEPRAEFCQIFRSFFGVSRKMLLRFTDLYTEENTSSYFLSEDLPEKNLIHSLLIGIFLFSEGSGLRKISVCVGGDLLAM